MNSEKKNDENSDVICEYDNYSFPTLPDMSEEEKAKRKAELLKKLMEDDD